jgi:pimeloyl-ACP methyl ester carboxylesterase
LEFVIPSLAKYILVRVFFTPFNFKPRAGELEMKATGQRFEFEVNGNKTVAHSWGKGPIAVLSHGWSGRGMQLRLFIEPLVENGYTVITFDAPGHGESEGKESSLIEFKDAIVEISKLKGEISLGVGHSLGGAALIYAAKEGLNISRLITISTPTIPDDIIDVFLARVNASSKMSSAIDNYVFDRTGEHFDYYSVDYNAPLINEIPILSFHDKNDSEAGIMHAYNLRDKHSNTQLVETSKLGHNRILKDDSVVQRVKEYTRELNLA